MSAAATTTIGPSTLREAVTNDESGKSGGTYIEYSGMAPAPEYVVPVDGTIVSWQIETGSSGGPISLRVLRPLGGGKFTGIGTSPKEMAAAGLNTFATSLPVKAGDVIGIDNESSIIMFAKEFAGGYPSLFPSGLPDGSPATMPEPLTPNDRELQLQINAQIEPTQSVGTKTGPPPGSGGSGTGGGGQVAPGVSKPQSAPSLAGLRIGPNAFRAAPSGNTIASGGKKGTGAAVNYTDSQVATTTFAVLQSQPGRRSASGACVKPSSNNHGGRCTRLVALARFARSDAAGSNRFHFTGRINGRRLKPGRYELRATARNSTGLTSRAVVAEFRIQS